MASPGDTETYKNNLEDGDPDISEEIYRDVSLAPFY